MSASLTLAQTIAIATHKGFPPLHARDVLKPYPKAAGSLRTLRDQLQSQQCVFVVQLRSASIVSASNSFADLQANWNKPNAAWTPTRQELSTLLANLKSAGITVHRLSQDWRGAVMTGPAASFASISGEVLSELTGQGGGGGGQVSTQASSGLKLQGGWGDIGVGLGGTSAVLLAAGAITGPPGWLFCAGAILGAAVAGAYVGSGVYDVVNAPDGSVTTVANPGYTVPSSSSGGSSDAGAHDATVIVPDATVVYGATSQSNAAAIQESCENGQSIDPDSLPTGPPAPPTCPTALGPVQASNPQVCPVCPTISFTESGGTGGVTCPAGGDPGGGSPGGVTCPSGANPGGITCPTGGGVSDPGSVDPGGGEGGGDAGFGGVPDP